MGITVKDLNFSYPSRNVLKNISFEINDGEFVGLVGSTGSGKTTLAYCLNGLIPNSIRGTFSGFVRIYNMLTTKHKVAELARKIGLVFQDPDYQLFSLTVGDEVAFGPKNLRLDKIETRVKKALKLVGLNGYEDIEPHKLSQGQKQKLCIACVLAMQPEIIILDEPTSQLDYKSTRNIYELLKKLNKKGKTILVIEHDTDLLTEYSDRVLIMDNGKIVRNDLTEKVFSDTKFLKRLGVKVPNRMRIE